MAMTTKIVNKQSSLKRRIRQFYNLLNQGDFERCHQMIDPRVRHKPSSVTLFQYENALRQFLDTIGRVKILEVGVDLHLNEPSELSEGRNFAVGKTTWANQPGAQHVFLERWVWENRFWYTRSTGFVTPTTAKRTTALPQTAMSSGPSRRRKQPAR